MCWPSVPRQEWVTIFACAVWPLSFSAMKKPSCQTLRRLFHICLWVTDSGLLFIYYYCWFFYVLSVNVMEQMWRNLRCDGAVFAEMSLLSEYIVSLTFLRTFLIEETMKQKRYRPHATLFTQCSPVLNRKVLFLWIMLCPSWGHCQE